MLVEIMQLNGKTELYQIGDFRGPFPSSAPTILIDTAVKLRHTNGIVGGDLMNEAEALIRDKVKSIIEKYINAVIK